MMSGRDRFEQALHRADEFDQVLGVHKEPTRRILANNPGDDPYDGQGPDEFYDRANVDDSTFHGVAAPAWADDHVLAEILRQEAADERDWFGTDRDKALLLTAADCIDRLDAELSAALHSIADQEAMRVEISDLRSQVQNRDAVMAAFDNDTYTTIEVEQARLVRLVAKYPDLAASLIPGGRLDRLR